MQQLEYKEAPQDLKDKPGYIDELKKEFLVAVMARQGTEDVLQKFSNAELIGLFKEVSGYDSLQSFLVTGFFALPQERLVDILSTHTMELIQTFGANGKYNFTDSIFKLDKAVLPQILTPDNVLGLLRNIEPRDVREFIDNLFSLPQDIVQPLITTHKMSMLEASEKLKGYITIKMHSESNPTITRDNVLQIVSEYPKYITWSLNALFDIPSASLGNIITSDNLIELIKLSRNKYDRSEFIQKVASLPPEIFRGIFDTKDIAVTTKAILDLNLDTSASESLCCTFQKHNLKLSYESIKDWNLGSVASMPFIKLTNPVIEFVEPNSIEGLHPTIRQLLGKTYINANSAQEAKSFAESWIEELNRIMQSNLSLKMILENAATKDGDVTLTRSKYIKSVLGDAGGGSCDPKNLSILIADGINNPIKALSSLVHEATHKMIQTTFNNNMLPYDEASRIFVVIEKAMSVEAAKNKGLYSKLYIDQWKELGLRVGDALPQEIVDYLPTKESWLEIMLRSYSKNKFAIELFPWFTQQISEHILDIEAWGNSTSGFSILLWDYLNQNITIRTDPEPLAPFCYEDYSPTQEEEGSLTAMAKKIVSTSEPNIRWLEDEAGQLAFQSIRPLEQIEFVTNLPQEELTADNVVRLFKHTHIPRHTLINKLFSLPHEKLLSIVTHDNVDLLISVSGDFKFLLIDKILALAPEDVASIITHDNFALIQVASGKSVYKLQGLLPPSPDEAEIIVQSENALPSVEDAEYALTELLRMDETDLLGG